MKKIISLFILVSFLVMPAISQENDYQVKYGKIGFLETWSGKILLIGDVIIPEGEVLTIQPGTEIKCTDEDITKGGKYPDRCEIIVKGKLKALGTQENPIKISSTFSQDSLKLFSKDTAIIKFKPYKIDTEPLRKEFHSFKIQYLLLWGFIYGISYLIIL